MHQGGNAYFKHQLFRYKFTELNEIFWFMSLRYFAVSLVAIFIPVYMYKLGYGLRGVILLYLLMFLFEACFEYFSAWIINHVGPKHAITISVPFWLFHISQFYTLETYRWPIWSIALSGGISLAFFWQAYHFDFSKAKKKKETTKQVSNLYIILNLLGAIAPLIGGVIATRVGVNYTFLLAMFLLLVGIFILFKTKDQHSEHQKINLKRIKLSKINKDAIAYIGSGWEATASVIFWPLFVILIVGSYEALGLLASIALVLSVIIMFYVGKKADNGDRQKYLVSGNLSTALVYFFQIFVSTAFHVGLANVFRNVAHSFSAAPFMSEYYLHADEEGRSEYLLMMETIIDLGRVLYFSILYGLTFFLSQNQVLIIAILLGGVGMIMCSLMPKAKSELKLENREIKIMPRPARRINA